VRGDAYQAQTVTAVTENIVAGVDLLDHHTNGNGPGVPPMGAGPSLHDLTYRPLWLRYGRFDQDALTVEEINAADGSAIVRVALIDLPENVP
jgi:hypothetical protein